MPPFAASGDFRNAAAEPQLALSKAKGLSWDTRAMGERLDADHDGKPWRGALL